MDRNMAKKILLLLLIVIMPVCFSGCGEMTGDDTNMPVSTEPVAPAAPAAPGSGSGSDSGSGDSLNTGGESPPPAAIPGNETQIGPGDPSVPEDTQPADPTVPEDTQPTDPSGPDTANTTDPEESSDQMTGQNSTPAFGFIDLHADTPSRAILRDQGLYKNTLDVDFVRLLEFGAPVQVFVAWCSDRYVATAFEQTNIMFDLLDREIAKHSDIIAVALTAEDMEKNAREGKISAVLAIEGGEALMGKIENLDHFYNRGVRILAPVWNRENELGYGQATGSKAGLKPFGIECIKRMDELGMILDVSHLNEAGFWDAHNNSTRPYMASHSNAYAVTPHDRNLKDDQITAIVGSGGIIGFNLYPLLLTGTERAGMSDVLAHFRHLIGQGAGDHLGLGCDFDGIPTMPAGITSVSSLRMLGERLSGEFGEDMSRQIMYGNIWEFFKRYFN